MSNIGNNSFAGYNPNYSTYNGKVSSQENSAFHNYREPIGLNYPAQQSYAVTDQRHLSKPVGDISPNLPLQSQDSSIYSHHHQQFAPQYNNKPENCNYPTQQPYKNLAPPHSDQLPAYNDYGQAAQQFPTVPHSNISNGPSYNFQHSNATPMPKPSLNLPNSGLPPFPDQSSMPYAKSTLIRSPGSSATNLDWLRLNTPINLFNERDLLPSDGPDIPIKPALNTPVNCDPDVMRCTLTNVPSSAKLLNQCRLPLGLIMHPFKDLSNLHTIQSTVIVRCRSCRSYINPFVQFLDSGRRWRCPVCYLTNSVPEDFYFDPNSETYGDPARRPEIRSATVEFIANSDYMLRPPQPSTYLFCFDVSHNAVSTGYLHIACTKLISLLDRLPGDSRAQVAFITYDSCVHFYKLTGNRMKMLKCPDIEELFIPDNEGLINRISESIEPLQEFLKHLPNSFANTNDVGNCLGPTLKACLKLIGSIGGRVSVFNTCIPNLGEGSLKVREEASDINSVHTKHLGPAIDFYKTFALNCVSQQVAVDMFILNSCYCDIATLSGASRFSSGTIYHYPNFCYDNLAESAVIQNGQSFKDESKFVNNIQTERFSQDLERYLTRKIGFEAVMRIRCTHGLTIQAFHGSFFVRSTDLLSLPNVSPDTGYAVQLDLSEPIDKYNTICCQAAILYTSSKGDRRIRVHTLCLPVVHTPTEVFQGADQSAIACLLSKMAVDRTINQGLSNAREALANSVADALSAYASNIGGSAPVSSTILYCPPNLRLLPLYVCSLLRYKAFRVGITTRLDDRSAALERIKTAPPSELMTLIYPKLYAVHQFVSKPISSVATLAQKAATLSLGSNPSYGKPTVTRPSYCDGTSSSDESEDIAENVLLPPQLHLMNQSIARSGVYLLDNGEMLLIVVGTDVASSDNKSQVLKQLFNINSLNELPSCGGLFDLPEVEDAAIAIPRRRLMAVINLLRQQRPINNVLVLTRHDSSTVLRTIFLSCLTEDKTEFAPSYNEFLLMVQNLMNL